MSIFYSTMVEKGFYRSNIHIRVGSGVRSGSGGVNSGSRQDKPHTVLNISTLPTRMLCEKDAALRGGDNPSEKGLRRGLLPTRPRSSQ
jgi:hypothetical protein